MIDDEAQQVHAVEVKQIADGAGPGAIVEHSGASSNDGLAVGCGGIGEAETWSEVVRLIVKVILPVVAEADVKREVRLQADVVFEES